MPDREDVQRLVRRHRPPSATSCARGSPPTTPATSPTGTRTPTTPGGATSSAGSRRRRLAAVHWPPEYGGRGATLTESAIFFEELGRSGAPLPANVLGLLLAGPTIMTWGTPEQKERHLAPILSADEIWCQGFSEPDAGSDLAALKTRAVSDGDDWVVTGQKVWTSGAQYSKWCMLVARTDPDAPKHKGLTYFLMDMEQAGVEVVPLRQITGEPEFNELFIDGARIPDANVLGGEGNGWKVALTTLMNERAGLGFFAAGAPAPAARRADRRRPPAAGCSTTRSSPTSSATCTLRTEIAAADRLPRADRDREVRPARARGLADSSGCGRTPTSSSPQLAADLLGPAALEAGTPLGLRAAARARQLDRGRHHRGAQEHRRRARARPAQGALRGARNGLRPDPGPEGDQDASRASCSPRARRGRRCARRPRPRAYGDALWGELAELGWPGIAVAEEHGGQGLGAVELAVLLEELGYACAATPFLSTAAGRRRRSRPAARDEQRARWLPALASGEATGRRRDARAVRRRRRAPPCSCCSTATRRAARRGRRGRGARRRSTRRAATRRVSGGSAEPLRRRAPPTASARPSRPRSSASASRRST